MNAYSDGYWQSGDGLRLHYRDYAGRADRPPVVCLPGLTRNARDFATLAQRLAGEWRVVCPELRGRGDSEYVPDALTYTPQHYLADTVALLDQLGITRFVAVGTSLGGLLTMALAMTCPQRLAGAVLNDIGPEIAPAGLAHIASYLGWINAIMIGMRRRRRCERLLRAAIPIAMLPDGSPLPGG